jgi:hypothetical protein
MSGHLLLDSEIVEAKEVAPRVPPAVWTALMALGLPVALLGAASLVPILLPPQLGDVNWEFQAIATTFSSLLPVTAGLAILGAGLIGRQFYMASKLLALALLAVTAFLAGFVIIYAVDVQTILNRPVVNENLKSDIITTSLLAFFYICFYSWGAWYLRTRSTRHSFVMPEVIE